MTAPIAESRDAPALASGSSVAKSAPPLIQAGSPLRMRFMAIWIGMLALLVLCALVVPRSLLPSTFLAIIPLAAFLGITAIGEALVLMARGIDLSIPAIITLSSTIILGFSRGREEYAVAATVGALFFATAIGVVNGVLVAVFKLNALIVTLAIGAITSGATLWYRESLPAEARVPPGMAELGDARLLGLNVSVWVGAVLVVMLSVGLRKTTVGRRFSAVGANPRAAWVAGINVTIYEFAAYVVAGLLYGVVGILLSAFIRNPTLKVGDPYLLAPIAAAVLGGTAISGGIGSMTAVAGAALFLTQLGQMLKMLGLSSAFQFIIQGAAIGFGMAVAGVDLQRPAELFLRARGRTADLPGSAEDAARGREDKANRLAHAPADPPRSGADRSRAFDRDARGP
jgi:ribose transport system permease protein